MGTVASAAIRQIRILTVDVHPPVQAGLAAMINREEDMLIEEALTRREIQVLQLVAWGNRNKQVAAQHSIADETVRMQ